MRRLTSVCCNSVLSGSATSPVNRPARALMRIFCHSAMVKHYTPELGRAQSLLLLGQGGGTKGRMAIVEGITAAKAAFEVSKAVLDLTRFPRFDSKRTTSPRRSSG